MRLRSHFPRRQFRRVVSLCAAALLWAGPPASGEADIRHDAVVDAVARILPSVVNVATESVVASHDPFDEFFRQFYHYPMQSEVSSSIGSGVIISPDGYLLTNLHVVNRASRIQVKLSDEAGGGVYDVERVFVGSSQTDVAALKIVPHQKGETFKAAHFAQDDDLLLGETVIALGNPFGLGVSVSRGILSSKRRAAPKENEDLNRDNWLQTDALINPGNSGGPLINLRGDLIGINVAMMPGAQGIGFAIPIKEVRQALGDLLIPETAARWFGARMSGESRVVVESVEPDGPADRAGLKPGDRIVAVDGREPADFIEFNRTLRDSVKTNFVLTAERGGERLRLELRLAPFVDLLRDRLGVDFQELTPKLVEQLGLGPLGGMSSGLLVARVEKEGPAAAASVREYFIVNGIEGEHVDDYYHAFQALKPVGKGEVARFSVLAPQTHGDEIFGYRQGIARIKLR